MQLKRRKSRTEKEPCEVKASGRSSGQQRGLVGAHADF